VALPHGKTRKTHYWHKKSQYGKRRKILVTVKSVKNKDPGDLQVLVTLFSQALVGLLLPSAHFGSQEN
jgi:hypothetical protein